jgi:hypothetical protein
MLEKPASRELIGDGVYEEILRLEVSMRDGIRSTGVVINDCVGTVGGTAGFRGETHHSGGNNRPSTFFPGASLRSTVELGQPIAPRRTSTNRQ